jgi:hypothetical protein
MKSNPTMKLYYLNPEGHHLIIVDAEKSEALVLEQINHVRVVLAGTIHVGDFDGRDDEQPHDKEGNSVVDGRRGPRKKAAKVPGQHNCSKCGKPGHSKRTCTN